MKSLLRSVPWYGYILLSLSGLVLVVSVGFYAFTTFDGHTIHGSTTGSFSEHWRWKGSPVLLESTSKRRSTTCFVAPEQGEARTVGLAARGRSGGSANGNRSKKLQPWFSGSATISCTQSVTEYSGAAIGRRRFSQSAAFRFGAPAAVLVPIGLLILISVSRKRRTTDPSAPWPPPPSSSTPSTPTVPSWPPASPAPIPASDESPWPEPPRPSQPTWPAPPSTPTWPPPPDRT